MPESILPLQFQFIKQERILWKCENYRENYQDQDGPDGDEGGGVGAAGADQALQRPRTHRLHQDPQEEERQISQEVHR